MKKWEGPKDGRRCYACKGPGHQSPILHYQITEVDPPNQWVDVDMHPVCVGAWLMGNEGLRYSIEFIGGM